jgi:hypothetical protein
MKPRADYTGKKFGLLTVVSCVEPSDGKNRGGLWMCKCKCRRFANFTGYQLHSRNSCGCLGRKAAVERGKLLRKPSRERLYTEMYARYKRECKLHNEVPVYKQVFIELAEGPCEYCGWKDTPEGILNYVIDGHTRCYKCRDMGKAPHVVLVEHLEAIKKYLS